MFSLGLLSFRVEQPNPPPPGILPATRHSNSHSALPGTWAITNIKFVALCEQRWLPQLEALLDLFSADPDPVIRGTVRCRPASKQLVVDCLNSTN